MAESLAADVYSCVHSKVSHGQTAAEGASQASRTCFHALVAFGQSAALQENSPWHEAMQRQHCSLLIRLTARQASPSIHLSYDQAVYADEAIQGLAVQLLTVFTALLTALSATDDQASVRVKDLPWVSEQQRERLLELAIVSVPHKDDSPQPLDVSTQALFARWAANTPDQMALVHGSKTMTYGELHYHVSALAYRLHAKYDASHGARVAIFGQRSVETSMAIMAVVCAGGAFVPIDSQIPADRVAHILDDSRCSVILTTLQDAAMLPTHCTQAVVHVDQLTDVLDGQPFPTMNAQSQPSDLAYIIYTSGTTGRPKGVMVEYGCLENVILHSALTQCFQPGQVCLQFFSVSFDPHLFVLLSALTHGCTLRIMRDDNALSVVQSVEVAAVTPSFLARIDPMSCPNVRTVIVTGEACPQALADKWAKQCTLVNGYGLSETFFTHAQWLGVGKPVDIGKPLVNVSSYVVDQNLHLVPMGVVGELLIGGVAPGRGYCNLPELTAERFLPNPFGPGRVYRTGDLVRWLPDGHLEYLGRRDNQVKLNGFRIELEEIESVVGQCSQVQQAAAVVHHNRLLCFITPELSDFALLVDHLRQTLPHYMVPHTLVALAQFPTTVNGKVDRRALADLDLTSTLHCSLVADSTALDLDTDTPDHACIEQEAVLRQAWAELLDVPLDRITRNAHFFQLGGDSIVAILLVSKCRQQGYQLTVPTVYAHPVLASLARQLVPLHDDSVAQGSTPPSPLPLSPTKQWFAAEPPLNPDELDQLKAQLTQRHLSWHQVEDMYPCTPLQSHLLLFTLRNPHAYLVQYHVTLTGDLDVHRLEASWQQIAQRHSILRTVFLEAPSQVTRGFVQAVLKQSIVRFDADLAKAADELSTQAYQRLYTDFALDSPLFQVSVGALPNATNAHQMTVTFHHAMLDGWSFPLLVAEVLKSYHNTHSPALTSSSFRLVTQRILDARLSTAAAQFWQEYLADAPPSPAPLLSATTNTQATGYSDYRTHLPIAKSTLVAFARRHGLSTSTLLRGTYALVLSRYLSTDQVVFGVTVAGRNLDVDNITTLISPCLTTVPFRVSIDNQPVLKWLQQLHENYVGMIPYEQSNVADITRWCQIPSHTPLFGTMMRFENQPPIVQDPTHALQATSITFTDFTEYAFGVAFQELPDAILCKVGYANAWYESDVGPRVVQHLAHVLEQLITADHTRLLGTITLEPVIIDSDYTSDLVASGEHSVALVDVRNVTALAASNVSNRIALQMTDHAWTYSQLLARANSLAQRMYAVGSGDQQPLVVALVDDVSDLAAVVLASMITQAHLVPVASRSPNLDVPTLVHHLQSSLVLAPTATLSQHLPVPVLAISADIGDSAPPLPKLRSHVHCFKLSVVDGVAARGVILKTVDGFSTAVGGDGHVVALNPNILAHFCLELSLWALLRALHQGNSVQTFTSAVSSSHPSRVTEYQILRSFTNFTKPNHAIVYFVDLADLLAFCPDPSLPDDTIVYVFHGSLFSTHASITIRDWRHSRWPTLRMPENAYQVVDRYGAICPIGVVGRISSVARSFALHTITSGKPSSLDGSHSACPVLGLYSSQGALQLVGALAHRMTVNAVQWHPSSVLPVLIQLGWQNPIIKVLSSSEWMVFVSNTGFDVAYNINQLITHLPAHCPLPTVVSYAFFPHLPRIASDAPKLRAFVAGYTLATSTAHGSTDDVALWLATIWHSFTHDQNQSVSDISVGGFWDIGGTLADLVQLRYLINERFDIALTMAELWNNTRFSSMVRLVHKALKAPTQLERPHTPMAHIAVLYRSPLPLSRLSIWCQAQLYTTMGSHYFQQTGQWPCILSQATMQTALDHVVATHAQCRLSFVEEFGMVYQRVHANASVTIRTVSLDNDNPTDNQAIDELANQHHCEFDLQVPGLISIVLLADSLSSSEHYHAFLSVRVHPLVGDQSLVAYMMRKLLVVDQSGDPTASDCVIGPLPALTLATGPADHRDDAQSDDVDYWTSIFMDAPWHLNLPDDRITLADPTWQFSTM
ncbi:hypothetical protein H4R35_005403, partial [Dimargaris xerosporica]